MNKAITDGIQLMPPPFSAGLDVWSRGNGTSGSATYEGASDATLIAADADFGACLELLKTEATQKLRYMGETPILPGCYWRITARVKAISGPLPSVRIAAWAGGPGGVHVTGLVETGPSAALSTYGEVVEVSAIVGSGARNGVDMIWGLEPIFGHFGLDLTGPSGGVIRIDDLVIEDVSSIYTRTLIDVVNVVDFGAVGDGVTDNVAAFEAADAAAGGMTTVLVPEGIFHLGSTVTMNSRVRFQGTVTMPAAARLELSRNFDFPTYFTAFGDEQLALEKALQALFNFTDHDALDLGGREINIDGPIDVQAAVGNKTSSNTRRVIRNGRISANASAGWNDAVVTRSAVYDPSRPIKLTGIANAGGIPVGSLVTAPTGVGREVYVRSVDAAAGEVTLSLPLWGASGTQTYTFTRFQYLLDFSGFDYLGRFVIENVDFACNGRASGLMIASGGLIFHVKDCFFTSPKDRGLTSIGSGCAGMLLDRCQWLSNEQDLAVSQRHTIGFNANSNDVKVRNNRAIRFATWGVMAGTGMIVSGNHFFQDDPTGGTVRSAGLALTSNSPKAMIVGNYIDQCFIDWTNEHDATPSITTGFSFSSLTCTGNQFTNLGGGASNVFFQIKPHGTGHFLNNVTISHNVFKIADGPKMTRVEYLDDSIAGLNADKARNITVEGNSYLNVEQPMMNPVTLTASRTSTNSKWTLDCARHLPFGLKARRVTACLPKGALRNGAGQVVYAAPHAETDKGVGGQSVELHWGTAVSGEAEVTVRCDDTI